jgi:hypothetical protein
MHEPRLIYASTNGDRWVLVRNASGHPVVRHEANPSSGATVTETAAWAFLDQDDGGPQCEALRAMLRTDGAPNRSVASSAWISPAQIRAARGLLHWSREKLAREARIAIDDVRGCEDGVHAPRAEHLAQMAQALAMSGIVFIGEGELANGGPGVRMGSLGTSTGQPIEASPSDANDNAELVPSAQASARS